MSKAPDDHRSAIRARVGDWGLIPGAMGRSSYVVVGKGDAESFTSASHGAGRLMSRTQAKRTFSVEEHAAATEGVSCDKSASTLDETPGCYKDIDAVLLAEKDLIDVRFELFPKLVVKGIGEGRSCRGEEGIDS